MKTWLAALAVAAFYIFLRAPLIGIPFERDEGSFALVARGLGLGELPYRDYFDHKPPVVYGLYAAALQLFPPTPTGVHLFLHLLNALSVVMLWFLVREMLGRTAAWGAAAAFAVAGATPSVQGFSAMTENLSWPFVIGGLWAARASGKNGSPGLLLLSGILNGLAAWTKQTLAVNAAFALATAVAVPGLPWAVRTRRAAIWAAGAAAVSLLVAAPFLAAGLGGEFLYANWTHNREYAGFIPLSASLLRNLSQMGRVFLENAPWAALAFFGLGMGLRKKTHHILWLAAWALASWIATVPGYAYPHYFAMIVPALAAAAGAGWAALGESVPPRFRRTAMAGAMALGLWVPALLLPWYFGPGSPEEKSRRLFPGEPFAASALAADALRGASAPEDRVFIMGSEPQIAFLSGRRPATGFMFMNALLQNFTRHREFQRDALAQARAARPPCILYVMAYSSLPWDRKADPAFMKEVAAWVDAEYELARVIGFDRRELPLDTPADAFGVLKLYRRRPEQRQIQIS